MGISVAMGTNLTPEEAEPLLLKAIELGCTFWDTAISHQPYHPSVPAKDCQKLTSLPHIGCLLRWN
jgi:aryl-alcohol dehydrogenase-like predicted oxidoreductase